MAEKLNCQEGRLDSFPYMAQICRVQEMTLYTEEDDV